MTTIGFKYHSGPVRVIEALEASSQSFGQSDLVYLSGGKVLVAATDNVIMGTALKAATNTTSGWASIPIQVITPETLFVAQVDTTSVLSQVGEDYGVNILTTQCHSVNIAETTSTTVRVERLDSRDGAKALGRVIVRFNPKVLQSTRL